MRRTFLTVLVIGILMMSACSTPVTEPDTPALPDEKEATEEPATEEPAGEEPVDEEPTDEEPADEEPADEEPTDEEPATEEPAYQEPKPAYFSRTNLQIEQTPEVSDTSYTVSVDVQNTGGMLGVCTLTPTVNGENVETIEVQLNPGQKKTVILTETQEKICSLAMDYKNTNIFKSKHEVALKGLRKTVTFPRPDYKLQLLVTQGKVINNDILEVTGRIKNISGEELKKVEVVAEFFTDEGELITSKRTMINRNPLPPDEISTFEVSHNAINVGRYRVYFQFYAGDRIPTDYSQWNR